MGRYGPRERGGDSNHVKQDVVAQLTHFCVTYNQVTANIVEFVDERGPGSLRGDINWKWENS